MKTSIILFLIALTIRLAAILFWRFDGLYGQDPFAYFQQGLAIVDNLPQGRPPPGDFFWPNGYPLLIALFTLPVGKTAPAGQLAALLCGSLLSPLVYWLTRDLLLTTNQVQDSSTQAHWAGLLAGMIIAVAGQPILSSIVIMADMPALFWATLSTWLAVRALLSDDQRHTLSPAPLPPRSPALYFLAAGITLALAIITRWIYILIVPALVSYTVFKLRQAKHLWWYPVPAVVGGLIILAPQLWLSINQAGGLSHSWLTGWHPANFVLRHFENIDGQFSYILPVGVYYAQPAGHPAYIFPVLGLAALWGLWQLWRSKQWATLLLLLGWAVPVYLFLAGIPYQNFRFGLTLYVPLVILTGFGLSELRPKHLPSSEKEPESDPPLSSLSPTPPLPGSPALLNGVIILSLLGMLIWAYPMLNNFLNVQNHSKTIAWQVEQALPPEATLLTFGLTLTLEHYTRLNTLELFHLDQQTLETVAAAQDPLYLLLDLHNLETQWLDKIPYHNYNWLKANTVLIKVRSFPPYTLFKVEKQQSRREFEHRSQIQEVLQ